MANLRKTKIVATLGPTSSDKETVTAMVRAGMNVARFNFSHETHAGHRERIECIRDVSKETDTPIAILQDLGGPKIRIGEFKDGAVELKKGARFILTNRDVEGTEEIVSLNYPELPREVSTGVTILLNDGKVRLLVEATTDTDITTTVVIGGAIKSRRGVNVPSVPLSIPAITPKDKKDIVFGIEMGVNFVTLSFVRYAQDVRDLRALLGTHAQEIGIIAKIETAQAVENIDEIIAEADGIMVARGDLAIEIPKEDVPIVQKTVIKKCNQAGKPVITATQMLDSMKASATPTRAEVGDVANAIFDGTDAIMLSDETAVGEHPALAVETMADIARHIETTDLYKSVIERRGHEAKTSPDAVTNAIASSARSLNVQAIVAFSESGYTGRLVARHRPSQPIVVLTPHKKTFYQSILCFGCYPEISPVVTKLHDAIALARTTLTTKHLAKKDDYFILGAGHPFGESGPTNLMLIERV